MLVEGERELVLAESLLPSTTALRLPVKAVRPHTMSRAILRLPNSLSRAAIPCPCLAAARLFSSSSSFASTSAQARLSCYPRTRDLGT